MENYTDSSIFIEKYEDTRIIIDGNNNINSFGIIGIDEKGNYLNDIFYQSDNYIAKCTSFNGVNSLLLYTETQFAIITGTFDKNNTQNITNFIKFKPNETISYKINPTVVKIDFNGESASTGFSSLEGLDIYKVELNGRVTDNYSFNTDYSEISFSNNPNVSRFGNYCTIYYSKSSDQVYNNLYIEFEYKAPFKYDVDYDELFYGIALEDTVSYSTADNLVTLSAPNVERDIQLGNYVVIKDKRYRVIGIESDTTFRVDDDFDETDSGVEIKIFKAYYLPDLAGDFSDEITYTTKVFNPAGSKKDIKKVIGSKSKIKFSIRSDEYYYKVEYDIEKVLVPVITTNIKRFVQGQDLFRIILAFHPLVAENKKVFYTNCVLIEGSPYQRGSDADNYSLDIDFEKRITVVEKGYDVANDNLYSDDSEQVGQYVITVE